MKKSFYILIFIFICIITMIIFTRRDNSYETEYEVRNYKISEKYESISNSYYFTVSINDNYYDYVISNDYMKNKKIVNNVNEINKDDYLCLSLSFKDKTLKDTQYQCFKDGKYYDPYIINLLDSEEKLIKTVKKIDIYNSNHDYYVWNGKGITNVLTGKEYNYFKNEHYDNPFSYQYNNYILFGDYDSNREFSKLIVFNIKDKKYSSISLENKISDNSYFMGDYENLIYFYDRKNKVQYSLDIDEEELDIVSNEDGGKCLNKEWTYLTLNNLSNNDCIFNNPSNIYFNNESNSLYYSYTNSNYKVLASNKAISSIVKINGDSIYYLVGDSLYEYNIYNGENKLLTYFEWNFTNRNKIFIF